MCYPMKPRKRLWLMRVFIFRKKHPEWERPYKAFGFPVFPVIYIYAYDLEMANPNLDSVLIEGNTITTAAATPFQIYVRNIVDAFCDHDPDGCDDYRRNAASKP